jgi:hypothetical protein
MAFPDTGSGRDYEAASSRHTPRMRGIQYAAASRFSRWCLWNTGSSAFADDDNGEYSRGAMRPKFCIPFALPKIRGRREDRVRAAPAVPCAMGDSGRTRAYRFGGNTPAFPAQWLYGLYEFAPVTGFLATVIPEKRLLLDDLTPAPGRQAHTTSPYALASSVRTLLHATPSRPPRPLPTFATTADAPRAGKDGGSYGRDLGQPGSGMFFG